MTIVHTTTTIEMTNPRIFENEDEFKNTLNFLLEALTRMLVNHSAWDKIVITITPEIEENGEERPN